jgi:hypothetical protein
MAVNASFASVAPSKNDSSCNSSRWIGDLGLHLLRVAPGQSGTLTTGREERILGAAEPLVGKEAGGAEARSSEQDKRRMADRPARRLKRFMSLSNPNCVCVVTVIASEAEQSIVPRRKDGASRFPTQ